MAKYLSSLPECFNSGKKFSYKGFKIKIKNNHLIEDNDEENAIKKKDLSKHDFYTKSRILNELKIDKHFLQVFQKSSRFYKKRNKINSTLFKNNFTKIEITPASSKIIYDPSFEGKPKMISLVKTLSSSIFCNNSSPYENQSLHSSCEKTPQYFSKYIPSKPSSIELNLKKLKMKKKDEHRQLKRNNNKYRFITYLSNRMTTNPLLGKCKINEMKKLKKFIQMKNFLQSLKVKGASIFLAKYNQKAKELNHRTKTNINMKNNLINTPKINLKLSEYSSNKFLRKFLNSSSNSSNITDLSHHLVNDRKYIKSELNRNDRINSENENTIQFLSPISHVNLYSRPTNT